MKQAAISAILVALSITFLLSACIFAPSDDAFLYRGNNPECYTVVLHTVLGTNAGDDAKIMVLDTDEYGRTMFTFVGLSSVSSSKKALQGLFIHYGVWDDCVLYREDGVFYIWDVAFDSACTRESVMENCTQEQIDLLKQAHDWNTPLSSGFTFRKIIRKPQDLHDTLIREEFFSKYSNNYYPPYDDVLDTDYSGKTIYFLREYDRNAESNQAKGKGFLMMVLPDGTVSAFEEVKDLLNYREQLIAFKNSNGWERITVSIEAE